MKIEAEEAPAPSPKKSYGGPQRLKKELQAIYAKIRHTQEDFAKAAASPRRDRPTIFQRESEKQNQHEEEPTTRKPVGFRRLLDNAENMVTPKKDPPCFRKLAFSKAELFGPVPGADPQQCVGDYIIGRQVGEGAYAAVKEGTQRSTGERVAVKIYDMKRLRGGSINKERAVEREIKLLKKMSHKNVVGFHASFRTLTHVPAISQHASHRSTWSWSTSGA